MVHIHKKRELSYAISYIYESENETEVSLTLYNHGQPLEYLDDLFEEQKDENKNEPYTLSFSIRSFVSSIERVYSFISSKPYNECRLSAPVGMFPYFDLVQSERFKRIEDIMQYDNTNQLCR